MRYIHAKVLDALDASVDHSSVPLDIANHLQVYVNNISTGAATGTVKIQLSNDIPGVFDSAGHPVITNWFDLSGATVAVTAASATQIPKNDICARWMRLFYTKNNGSAGTITSIIKTIGY